jgi:hypothetical protein
MNKIRSSLKLNKFTQKIMENVNKICKECKGKLNESNIPIDETVIFILLVVRKT